MSIESKIPIEELDVKDLTFDFKMEKAKKREINVADFYTEEDWDKVLARGKDNMSAWHHLSLDLENVPWVNPELVNRFPQNMTVFKNTLQKLNREKKNSNDWREYAAEASKFVLQYPRFRNSVAQQEDVWPNLQEALEKEKDLIFPGSNTAPALDLAIDMKVLFPEKAKEITFSESQRDLLIADLHEYRKFIKENPESGHWDWFISSAGNIKVMFPELKAEDLVSPEDYDHLVKLVTEDKDSGHYFVSLNILKGLRLLNAYKTEFTPEGVNIIDKEPAEFIQDKEHPLPEIKKF